MSVHEELLGADLVEHRIRHTKAKILFYLNSNSNSTYIQRILMNIQISNSRY